MSGRRKRQVQVQRSRADRHDPVDELVQREVVGLQAEAGAFTLDPQRAMMELGRLGLSEARFWILAAVQGVVAAGSSRLEIRQGRDATTLTFDATWEMADVERSWGDAQVSASRGLDRLKRGVWAAALGLGCTVTLELAGQPGRLLWSDAGQRREGDRIASKSSLSVSLLGSKEPHWLLLGRLQAARRRAEQQKLLRERLVACPLPVLLDGQRIDWLFRAEAGKYPYALLVSEDADFGWPAAKRGALSEGEPLPRLGSGTRPLGVAVASFGARRSWSHLVNRLEQLLPEWETFPLGSSLSWVQDGVVLARETVGRQPRSIALDLFISAGGMTTDVTGFGLGDPKAQHMRKRRVWNDLRELLRRSGEALSQRVERLEGAAVRLARTGLVGAVRQRLGAQSEGVTSQDTLKRLQRELERALEKGNRSSLIAWVEG